MTTETTYRNPWVATSGPEFYSTEARPTRYRGFLIYHRLPSCWDVVKEGVAVSQRAGFNGAKGFVDRLCGGDR